MANLVIPPPGFAALAAIADETTYGISKAAGTALTVPRGDHSHGSPSTPSLPTIAIGFTIIAPQTLSQAAGSAGWITDVDVSTTWSNIPANAVAVVLCRTDGANQNIGIRDTSSSADNYWAQDDSTTYQMTTMLVKVSATRTIDVYRAAAINIYKAVGYITGTAS